VNRSSVIYLNYPLLNSFSDLPPGIGRAVLSAGIHGLSTHKRVRHPVSPRNPVSSYLTFSPLSRHPSSSSGYKPGWLFSVTPLYLHRYLPVRKYGALRCPDFPPPALLREATERFAALQN